MVNLSANSKSDLPPPYNPYLHCARSSPSYLDTNNTPTPQPTEYIYKVKLVSYFFYSFAAIVAAFFTFYSLLAVVFEPFRSEMFFFFIFSLHSLCWLVWILNKKEYLFEGNIYLRCSSHLASSVLILAVFHGYWKIAIFPAVIHLLHYVSLSVFGWMMPWRREDTRHVVGSNPSIYYTVA